MGASPYFFSRIGDFSLYLYIQFFQYPLRFPHFSCLNVRDDYRIRINGTCEWQAQVFGIHSFCDLAEYATCHQTSRSGQTGFLDRNNHTVLRLFRWEVSAEADEIIGSSCLVAGYSLRNLCCSGLTGHMELLASCRFGKSFTYHFPQDFPYLCQRLVRTDLGIDDFRRIFLYHFSVSDGGFYKLRTYGYSVIGYCIIECQNIDRWNLRFIADAHPWQSRF